MKQYSYDKICKMLEPIMDMMKTEYPNDAVLIVQSDFANISYIHKDMCFSRSFDSGATHNNNQEVKNLD